MDISSDTLITVGGSSFEFTVAFKLLVEFKWRFLGALLLVDQ